MRKIIDYCKKEYKLLIPIMVILVLIVSIYFFYKEYQYDNTRNKHEVPVYQYFGGVKNTYTGIITYNLKNVIVNIEAKDKKINYDSTPVYFKDSERVIFPEIMSIVFPLQDGNQYRLYKYSEFYKDDGLQKIKTNNYNNNYNYFFLYDGKKLFFFPDEVTIYIDNVEYQKLSSMSYIKVVGGYTMEYYDYESDTAKVVDVEGKEISVSNNMYNINITKRRFSVYDDITLLVNPNNLNSID